MSRIAFTIGAASLLALGLTGPAGAELVTHKDLSLETAVTIAQTAVQTCKAQGYNVSAHVIGRTGEILVSLRGDEAPPHTVETSFRKAVTARLLEAPSANLANALKENPASGARTLNNVVPSPGALPIKVGQETIGAIGISGAPGGDKDEACAKAGLDKVAGDLK